MSFLAEEVSPCSLSLVILVFTEQWFPAQLFNLMTHRFQDTTVLFLPMVMRVPSCPFLLINFQAESSVSDLSIRINYSAEELGSLLLG